MMRFLKLFLCLTILTVAMASQAHAVTRNVQDNHQATYNIIDLNGDHVTGETVTLKIKRVSDGDWFDFNDSSFKSAGWTSKSTSLSEDGTEGYYYYTFNPPASETGAEQYLFCYDNASATYGHHQCETIVYQDIGDADDTSLDTQLATIQSDLDNPSQYKATGFSTHSAADVWTSGTRTITGLTSTALADFFDTDSTTDYASAVAGSVVKEIVDNAGGGGLTAGSIADAVWDEAMSGHTSSGSTGEALNNAGAAGNPWATDISSGYSGQAGEYLRNIQDATDGDKESGSYTGIENTIRIQR